MNKRIKKKKAIQRYNEAIRVISNASELPIEVVRFEMKKEPYLWQIAQELHNPFKVELAPYVDSMSVELMWKYGIGWAGKKE